MCNNCLDSTHGGCEQGIRELGYHKKIRGQFLSSGLWNISNKTSNKPSAMTTRHDYVLQQELDCN